LNSRNSDLFRLRDGLGIIASYQEVGNTMAEEAPGFFERLNRMAKGTISVMIPDVLARQIPYRYRNLSKNTWESEYSSGFWDYVEKPDELSRYSVTAGYVHFFSSGGPVLDVGCGVGLLKKQLRPDSYSDYVGIDLSDDAIRSANAKNADSKSTFVQANLEDYFPDRSFDVIVFNECLYYLGTPLPVIKRYESYLNTSGVFVVSMLDMLKSRKIWSLVDDAYTRLETVRCMNRMGFSWTIRVYRCLR
jgi:2-polyprenyl-3-methyl-5-hydroxy-6-metoxy-1,4-benzoquinol methylase